MKIKLHLDISEVIIVKEIVLFSFSDTTIQRFFKLDLLNDVKCVLWSSITWNKYSWSVTFTTVSLKS
jgi:hypothetical protein